MAEWLRFPVYCVLCRVVPSCFVGSIHLLPKILVFAQLKPRSTNPPSRRPRTRSLSSKSDPFGAAVPREQVLEKRGVDVKKVDDKIERKAAVSKFTVAQEEEIEQVRTQLTKITEELRNANENELPEENFRVEAEAKRKELNDLMEKFSKLNAQDEPRHKYTPRSHRNNQHEEGFDSYHRKSGRGGAGWSNDHKEEKVDDEAFSSFYSNRRRRRPDEQQPQQQST